MIQNLITITNILHQIVIDIINNIKIQYLENKNNCINHLIRELIMGNIIKEIYMIIPVRIYRDKEKYKVKNQDLIYIKISMIRKINIMEPMITIKHHSKNISNKYKIRVY